MVAAADDSHDAWQYREGVFKRNRDKSSAESDNQPESSAADADLDFAENEVPAAAGDSGPKSAEPTATAPSGRADGPFDITEAPQDGMERLDFGSVKVPGVDGMAVNLEVDEDSDNIVAITIVIGEGGVQIQPFAAPRSGDFWPEVREELTEGITSSGGVVETVEGPFGTELRAQVPAENEQGEAGLQVVRFVGADGPRWLLRGVMLGIAALGGREAELFEDVFRGCIVERGVQPMAPGDMLPMTIPDDAVAEAEADDDEQDDADNERPVLKPFERGPEITEIH